ncbi:Helix-turn-helix domain-containing protein [Anaerocolumna jejuensis DSM 15929]|uniref:Stage 0 sporulation protein A homolog n=1 Tax=Anaerocolumna jejuensis DSM 15929 TaxID=1121322 RepID=A0A1M7D8I3_9FIRM|nr:response regulator [Anaerocolumna jejuensis]SHL75822.1 Helix-turn-helix domain-containing protein [Anaerocolumna jejuensis DSM 15929]
MYKALIVDDEKAVQIAIGKLGKWHTYHMDPPSLASNGKEGLYAMRELRPDIVFVDMQMPVMNGIEFLKSAKEEFPDAKYIVISGYDDFYYAQNSIKLGAIDYILKPIVEEELNTSIKKALHLLNPSMDFTKTEEEQSISAGEVAAIIKDYIDKNYSQNLKLSYFSDKYYFSKEYLSKIFKANYEIGIYEYVLQVRMERAKELLLDESLKIQWISDRLGYTDSNYFSKAFRNYYGITPSQFRKN